MKLTASVATALCLVFVAIGCSSDDSTDSKSNGQFPASTSQSDIESFLASGAYKTWTGDAAIRGSENPVNAHGDAMRVFFNDNAVASGNEGKPMAESMIVKELYDESGAQVGTAVSMKSGDGKWTYYCTNEGGNLCTGQATSDPVYDSGATACGFCHGDLIYSPIP